jgi:cell division protein FtsQ
MLVFCPLLYCDLYQFEKENSIAEIKISGLEITGREDIFAIVGWDSGLPLANLTENEWGRWKSILQSHPRYDSVKIRKNRAVLEIQVIEVPVLGVVQIENDIFELGEGFQLISKNDLRSRWFPILTGDFRIQNDKLEGANFYSLWRQASSFREDFPDLWSRLSEIEARKDGDIYMYMHHPHRLKVNMGSFISSKQGRKLYASLAFMEAENKRAEFLDLRGEDGFYY